MFLLRAVDVIDKDASSTVDTWHPVDSDVMIYNHGAWVPVQISQLEVIVGEMDRSEIAEYLEYDLVFSSDSED